MIKARLSCLIYYFSNSVTIVQVYTKEITTVTVFGYVIIISTDFFGDFLSSLHVSFSLQIKNSTMFYQHLEVPLKYSAARPIDPIRISWYWTGTSLQMRLMNGVFSNANGIYPF